MEKITTSKWLIKLLLASFFFDERPLLAKIAEYKAIPTKKFNESFSYMTKVTQSKRLLSVL